MTYTNASEGNWKEPRHKALAKVILRARSCPQLTTLQLTTTSFLLHERAYGPQNIHAAYCMRHSAVRLHPRAHLSTAPPLTTPAPIPFALPAPSRRASQQNLRLRLQPIHHSQQNKDWQSNLPRGHTRIPQLLRHRILGAPYRSHRSLPPNPRRNTASTVQMQQL